MPLADGIHIIHQLSVLGPKGRWDTAGDKILVVNGHTALGYQAFSMVLSSLEIQKKPSPS